MKRTRRLHKGYRNSYSRNTSNSEQLNDHEPGLPIDPDLYKEFIASLKTSYVEMKIPYSTVVLITESGMDSLADVNERAKYFLMLLKGQRYKSSTVINYYNYFKKTTLLAGTTIVPDLLVFDTISPPQQKVPNFEMFDKVLEELRDSYKNDLNLLPIYMSYLTALRSGEVLSMTLETLDALNRAEATVDSLIRKNKQAWTAVYTLQLDEFVSYLLELNRSRIKVCETEHEPLKSVKLFKMSKSTLHRHFIQFYVRVVSQYPPEGFGLHWMRSYAATKLARNGHIRQAQSLLGHSVISSTSRYVRNNNMLAESKLEVINTTDPFYIQIFDSKKTI